MHEQVSTVQLSLRIEEMQNKPIKQDGRGRSAQDIRAVDFQADGLV
jgi:hypothetical protein